MTEEEFRKEVLLRAANLSKEDRLVIGKIISAPLTKGNGACYDEGIPVKCRCGRTLARKIGGKIFVKCPKCKSLHELNIQS